MTTQFSDTFSPPLATDDVLVGESDCRPYSYKLANGRTHRPETVVFPRNADQVATVLLSARRTGTGIIPRGAGTRPFLTIAPARGVVMSLAKMDRIVRIDKGNRIAVVEPGVTLTRLRRALAAEALFLPPYPYAFETATVGGCAANSTGGPAGLRHGVFKQNVLGMQLVTGGGTIMEIGAYTMKNVVGYDLSTLLCGSEGTLGIITRLNLRVASLPAGSQTLVAAFDTMTQAGEAVQALTGLKNPPDRLAIIDPWMLTWLARHRPAVPFPSEGAVLLCRVDGLESIVARNGDYMRDLLAARGARFIKTFLNNDSAETLWQARAAGLEALNRGGHAVTTADLSIPKDKAPALMARFEDIARQYDLTITNTGHSGGGVFQPVILGDLTNPGRADAARQALADLGDTVLSLDGYISMAYPCLGIERAKFNRPAPAGLDKIFKGLKAVFDPDDILKPGHFF